MTVKFDQVKPGDVLYDVRREKMGWTTISHTVCWEVVVKSIDYQKREAIVSWNGNPVRKYYVPDIRRLCRTPPRGTPERERFDEERALAKSAPRQKSETT
jgi:hypothetical protein